MTTIAGCIFNVLIFMAILSKKELRRRRANQFLCSLCLSDFLTCAYSVTYHLVHLHPEIYANVLNSTYCRTTQFFIYVLAFSSSLCLTGVCIDRYIAITKPFLYLSNKFSKIYIVLLLWPWVQSFLTTIPIGSLEMIKVLNSTGFPCGMESSWETLEVWSVIAVTNIILPFLCIFTTCIVVYRVARRQLREIQLQTPSNIGEQSVEESSTITIRTAFANNSPVLSTIRAIKVKRFGTMLQKDTAKRKFNRNFREEAKITFATIAVVFGFIVAWSPYLVTRLLFLVGVDLSVDVHMFGTAFVLVNSAWNPLLIFSLRNDIRKSVKRLCDRT